MAGCGRKWGIVTQAARLRRQSCPFRAGKRAETHDSVQIRNTCCRSCLRFQTTSGSVGYNVGV
ncbi:hypothetical protein [Neisseria sicca]|uniref:hypothetical protein n=1 Tax=Neisseria sicca TaxID=490 RepID=UPI0011BD1F87|nr:hypothetical protein [Neisseria sicca]